MQTNIATALDSLRNLSSPKFAPQTGEIVRILLGGIKDSDHLFTKMLFLRKNFDCMYNTFRIVHSMFHQLENNIRYRSISRH